MKPRYTRRAHAALAHAAERGGRVYRVAATWRMVYAGYQPELTKAIGDRLLAQLREPADGCDCFGVKRLQPRPNNGPGVPRRRHAVVAIVAVLMREGLSASDACVFAGYVPQVVAQWAGDLGLDIGDDPGLLPVEAVEAVQRVRPYRRGPRKITRGVE